MPDERARPFSNGSEYVDWLSRNCYRCSLETGCPMRRGLQAAYYGDGRLPLELAHRIGVDAPPRDGWVDLALRCAERVAKAPQTAAAD